MPAIGYTCDYRALAPAERRTAVSDLLQKQLAQVLRTPVHTLDPHQPLSEIGIDSLMTVELINRIEAELAVSIPLSTLLQGPTIENLSGLVVKLLDGSTPPAGGQNQPADEADVALDDRFACSVTDLVDEVVLDPTIQVTPTRAADRVTANHIFLTGATGFLGTFLFRDMLDTTGAHIHCLVRAEDAVRGRERLLQTLERSFPGEELAVDRIVAVPGDLAQPCFGLDASTFEQLAEQLDLIVHSGAQINWLAPYARLKPTNVLGTETIIRLAAHRRPTPVHYVSSLAVFPILGHDALRTIDERTPLDHGGVLHGGYTQSKWVAEKLVADAQARGLRAMIYRPSLVVGDSKTGAWQGDNTIANMLRSWIELGMAPGIEAQLDLVPVDYVSRGMVQLMMCGNGAGVYHLNNPHTVTVRELSDWLIESGYPIQQTPYGAWRSAMLNRGDVRRQTILDAVGPLLALQVSEEVEWLERIPRFGTERTQQMLEGTVCPPVDAATFRSYIDHLQRSGFLPVPA